jgi:hypothetical protein
MQDNSDYLRKQFNIRSSRRRRLVIFSKIDNENSVLTIGFV